MSPQAAALSLYAAALREALRYPHRPQRLRGFARSEAARTVAEALGASPQHVAAVTLTVCREERPCPS